MKNTALRYLFFTVGVAINSFGIAFITKSTMGTSPISSVPYVLSLQFPAVSFGWMTFILNMLFIAGQMILLRRDFRPVQLLQIGANILFSFLIDVSMAVLSFLQPAMVWTRILSLLTGCLILAVGVSIEVAPEAITVPGEGIVRAIAKVSGIRFGTVKNLFDITLMAAASILSFLFFGELRGIGAGTVIAAILVGKFVNLVNRHLPLIEKIRMLAEPARTEQGSASSL